MTENTNNHEPQKAVSLPTCAQQDSTPPTPSSGDVTAHPAEAAGGKAATYPLKMKGVMTLLNEEGDSEFRAQRSTGQSMQEVMATTSGGAKVYKTVGRRPQVVAHLTASADASDPYADLQAQLERLTAKAAPRSKAARRVAKSDRVLMNQDGICARLSRDGKISIQATIDLADTPDYTNTLISIMQKLSQCFLINQQYLQSACPAPSKR